MPEPVTGQPDREEPRQGRTEGRLRQRVRRSRFARRVTAPVASRMRLDETAGWPVIIAGIVALIWANSPWSGTYESFWTLPVSLGAGTWRQTIPLRDIVDLFLLPVFFFIVAVEIREELKGGHLAGGGRASLPVAAAIGGMVVPATFYLGVTWGGPWRTGFGVPVATDIAFALAFLLVLGDRVPASLKAFLLAFAAVDDVGGILVIAFVYGHGISWAWLAAAVGVAFVTGVLARHRAQISWVYVALGLTLWATTLLSGIHVTIAGVALGLLLPAHPLFSSVEVSRRTSDLSSTLQDHRSSQEAILGELEELAARSEAPASRLARLCRPWVSYVILPLFGLAMAGTPIDTGAIARAASHPASIGVALGLVLGKPIGVLGATWIAVRTGLTDLPEGMGWSQIAGVAVLAGIGFTVSLFMAKLAFSPEVLPQIRIAIFASSIAAGLAGPAVLALAARRRSR